jgi:hypothetical protein
MIGLDRGFLELVADSDNGAKVLHHLGNNLDEAVRITSLTPLKMAKELTLLDIKLASQTKKLSNAPEPITPVSATSAKTKSPDKMSDAEFAKWRRQQIEQRS